jgi:hypothetical protein
MVQAFRYLILLGVALAAGACASIATLSPGRIMSMTPEDLLRRVRAVAEDGRFLDQPFVERALGVRFGAVLPPSYSAPIERYPLTWIDAPEPSQRPFADRVRPTSGSPPFERLFLTLPPGARCITFQDARRILGEGFVVPHVSGGSVPVGTGPLSLTWRVRDAPATRVSVDWQGNACAQIVTVYIRIV